MKMPTEWTDEIIALVQDHEGPGTIGQGVLGIVRRIQLEAVAHGGNLAREEIRDAIGLPDLGNYVEETP